MLDFIDPLAANMLSALKNPEPSVSSFATTALTTRLELLDENVRDIAIWLVGAYMVNNGEGVFSSVIREYNRFQGLLRLGGWCSCS